QNPRDGVDRAAGGIGHDHGDRPRRPVLRLRRPADAEPTRDRDADDRPHHAFLLRNYGRVARLLWTSHYLSSVIPAKAGIHLPEDGVTGTMGPRLRGDDRRVTWQSTPSIRADPGLLDRLGPALDLLGQELGEVFRRAALGRHDLEAELLQ